MTVKRIALLLSFFAGFLNAEFIVSIIDDDSRSVSCLQTIKTIADEEQIKLSFAPIAANLEQHPEIAEFLRQLQKEGHDIASHSYSHSISIWKNPDIDEQAVKNDIEKANDIYRKEQLVPVAFVYPYGKFNAVETRKKIFPLVEQYFPLAFNSRGDANTPGETWPLYISRHPMRKHNSMIMINAMINHAAQNNQWLVILTHSGNADFSEDMLRKIIQSAKEHHAEFLTISQAAKKMTWTTLPIEAQPNYSLFHEACNVAYFHLPLLLCGIVTAGAILCLIGFFIYKKKKKKLTK